MMDANERNLLLLIERSPALDGGWRQVAPRIWTAFVEQYKFPELIERDEKNMRVRLTDAGMTVVKYL